MGTKACVAVVGLIGAVALAFAGDDAPFPEGGSTQTHDGREFQILMPDEFDPSKEYSLIVTIRGSTGIFSRLVDDGYIVVSPERKIQSATGGWSASEGKGIIALTKHLMKVLPIGKHRVHTVGVADVQGVFSMMAFGKGSPFVSATFAESAFRGGSVSGHLRKKMGVLAFDWDGTHAEGIKQIEHALAGKVRSVELRDDAEGLGGAYFAYWLGVMEGRFEPGHDLSFSWTEEAVTDKDIVARMKAQGGGAFLYFWSPDDADNKDAKALQNEVFFDPKVRRAGRALVAVKLQKEECAELFGFFGLKQTPAVVVVDPAFQVVKSFEGAVKSKALTAAMKKAAK